jgi:hypothetical protein
MMNKTIIIIIVLGVSILSGCYYDNKEELYPNTYGTQITCDTSNLTYTNSIKTIIDANCASSSCHGAGGTSPDLSSYINVTSNITRVKARAIDLKTMPASAPLSVCEINKLQAWINAGTPQ